MVRFFNGLPATKKIKPIVGISSPFLKNPCFDETYMDIKKEVERSLNSFKLLKEMNLPHDELFYNIKSVDDFDSFYSLTKEININIWVELLYWFVKKYSALFIDQYYLRWKIRALSFCLHEINTFKQAEDRTMIQAKTASDFMYRVGQRTSTGQDSRKMYYYQYR